MLLGDGRFQVLEVSRLGLQKGEGFRKELEIWGGFFGGSLRILGVFYMFFGGSLLIWGGFYMFFWGFIADLGLFLHVFLGVHC